MTKEFDDFLTRNFVKTKDYWKEYASIFTVSFLDLYYDNLNFINTELLRFRTYKNTDWSSTDKIEFEIIEDIFSLSNMITIDSNLKKISADVDRINQSFKKIPNKVDITEALQELLSKNRETVTEFVKLYDSYNALIDYVKTDEMKEYFFRKHLLNDQSNLFRPSNQYKLKENK